MRIVVAMSGGVDSSTAAALLQKAGHEVIGLAMKTHNLTPRANRACCTPDDMRDARRVADILDIPFYVLDYAELFTEAVIKPFAAAYQKGHTPNPCVVCNDKVKFAPLLARAKLLGADRLATGHYARIVARPDPAVQGRAQLALARACDRSKDQSYFLYRLGQQQLAQLTFPLGGMSKTQVRAAAGQLGLPVAQKPESQEICFVGAEGYAKTVERISGTAPRPGCVVDQAGQVIGHHAGIHHFTVGQRRGLGIASAQPLYVTRLDAAAATVQVGSHDDLLVTTVVLQDVVWAATWPWDTERIVKVQQRHRQVPRAARVVGHHTDSHGRRRLQLTFLQPEVQVSTGQAAVVYADDVIVGGGTIADTPHSAAKPFSACRRRLRILA